MKNILLILLLCNTAFSQKLAQDGKDEFTGKYVKVTEWENLTSSVVKSQLRYRIIQIDSLFELNIKQMSNGRPSSINKDSELMFMLENGDVISVRCKETSFSCIGCGATGLMGSQGYGIQTSFDFPKDTLKKLSSSKVIKARIYLNDGYHETDIKEKHAELFCNSLRLFQG